MAKNEGNRFGAEPTMASDLKPGGAEMEAFGPYSEIQQLPLGVGPAQAFAWFSRWASSAPKFLVPAGAQHASSGQLQGQGFAPGAVFETTFIMQHSRRSRGAGRGHGRGTTTSTSTTKMTWRVKEADPANCMVRFHQTAVTTYPNTIQLVTEANVYNDVLFKFDRGANGITELTLKHTMYRDDCKDMGKIPCWLYLIPCCWCMICIIKDVTAKEHVGAYVQQQVAGVASRMNFALQAAQQDGSIIGRAGPVQQQNPAATPMPVASVAMPVSEDVKG